MVKDTLCPEPRPARIDHGASCHQSFLTSLIKNCLHHVSFGVLLDEVSLLFSLVWHSNQLDLLLQTKLCFLPELSWSGFIP